MGFWEFETWHIGDRMVCQHLNEQSSLTSDLQLRAVAKASSDPSDPTGIRPHFKPLLMVPRNVICCTYGKWSC